MNRLARIIEELSADDLRLIKKDLEAGNIHKLIEARLEQLQERKVCPTCGTEMLPKDQKYSLEFGPRDLRQRAFFDEYDCLEYFLENTHRKQDGGMPKHE